MKLRSAIVMSKLPRLIDPGASWIRGLRAALRFVQQEGSTLTIVEGTAGSSFVNRGAVRLGIAVDNVPADDVSRLELTTTEIPIPPGDRCLAACAEILLALNVRANGNVHRLLQLELAAGKPVILVDVPGLSSRPVVIDLMERGAKMWLPGDVDLAPFTGSTLPYNPQRLGTEKRSFASSSYEVVPIPSDQNWIYLSHTTRSCPGPWPEESFSDYVDSLLDESAAADHSPLAALQRIVTQQRLIGSDRIIRDGHRVVCLTAVPLKDLPALRTFRNHRTRWDFEPYGICIDREWLQQRGARPVIYGDEATWNRLSESDRPYFQKTWPSVDTASENDHQAIDWSVEQEWRHRGDIDLTALPKDRALLFVPNAQAAQSIAPISRWPVTLWPEPSTEPN